MGMRASGGDVKINVEVDCTPEEARHFLGLPEVAPMQQRVLEAMERRLVEAIDGTDTQKLLDQWLPLGTKGLEQWQGLWTQLAQAAMGFPKPPSGAGGGGDKGKAQG
jgi:Family of unknown function (DUF6489)